MQKKFSKLDKHKKNFQNSVCIKKFPELGKQKRLGKLGMISKGCKLDRKQEKFKTRYKNLISNSTLNPRN